jgi:hypothetical protein
VLTHFYLLTGQSTSAQVARTSAFNRGKQKMLEPQAKITISLTIVSLRRGAAEDHQQQHAVDDVAVAVVVAVAAAGTLPQLMLLDKRQCRLPPCSHVHQGLKEGPHCKRLRVLGSLARGTASLGHRETTQLHGKVKQF